MPNLPISQLPAASALTGTELFATVQGGITKYTTMNAIYNNVSSSVYYGSFYDTASHSATLANTNYIISHSSTDFAYGVSLIENGKIKVDNAGKYTLISSLQIKHTAGGDETISVFPRINGNDVPNSNTDLYIAGNNSITLFTINYFFNLNANDVIELVWSATDTDLQLFYTGSRTNPVRPATPSIITTIARFA